MHVMKYETHNESGCGQGYIHVPSGRARVHTPSTLTLATLYIAEAEELKSAELKLEEKTITIELKENDQGKFVKIIETQTQIRGRIILSSNKAFELRSILNEFVAEYERLPPAEETTESERIKTYASIVGC